MEAKITRVYDSEKEAEVIIKSISPDNLQTPSGLTIATTRDNNKVTTLIEYEGENLLTFASTIDDLLSCLSIAEKSMRLVKKHRV